MYNRLLANPIPFAGVIVASGGNAGIATAAAAKALGVRSRKRCASSAAMQPVPALVMAWR
jgi:threonine dehydratase